MSTFFHPLLMVLARATEYQLARYVEERRRGLPMDEAMVAALKYTAKATSIAALAASIFHFGEYSIRETKQVMSERGIPVRL